MSASLRAAFNGEPPRRIVELGAGDGRFMLRVARLLSNDWPPVRASLLDRQSVVHPKTRSDFELLGWELETITADVFDWLKQSPPQPAGAMIANLFLHHFSPDQLSELFQGVKKCTRLFIAIEPRRSARSLVFSRMLWLIGCNWITRHDAPASVRAGFRDGE